MSAASACPIDLRLVLHENLSDSYERSSALLATAAFDGKLQLLTAEWEQLLGYKRDEFSGKTLSQLMWSNRARAACAVAAILDEVDMRPLELRVRCRNGEGKALTLHRLYDKVEQMMYIVAVETSAAWGGEPSGREDRRAIARPA